MKYFFLFFALAVLLVVLLAGPRGRHTTNRPLEFFPDMVRQAKVKPQSPSTFFADGIGPRRPVEGTAPMGLEIPRQTAFSQLAARSDVAQAPAGTAVGFSELRPRLNYTAGPDYYNTGKMGDRWGTGIPMQITPALLDRGQERFNINCAVCHGHTGSGNGVTSKYGINGIANYHDEKYVKMDDGQIFDTITNGKNTMLGYGANITVNDRWAIVAYIRALQRAQTVKLSELPPEVAQQVQNAKP
jgi:mono/diheme cytochrome c family protein